MAEKRTHYQRKETAPTPIPANEYGKLPPQALELEEDVLGAVMLEKGAMELISDVLKPEMFYKTAHQKIFETICDLHRHSNPIDMHTIAEMLRKNGTLEEVGGMYQVAMLTSKVSSSAHVLYHSRIIVQKFLARELIRLSSEVQASAFDETKDVADIMAEMERRFTEIRMDNASRGIKSMRNAVDDTRNHILELRKAHQEGRSMYVRTPLPELDTMLKGGFKNKKLIVVGARPRVGKTQFILETAKKIYLNNPQDEALLFNLEMDAVELVLRLLFEESAIDDYAIETGTYTDEQLQLVDKKLIEIEKMNLHIVDDEYDFENIVSKCRKFKRENPNLRAVFIDYLGLIKTGLKFQTRDLEIGHYTRNLKALSKELDLPIILLSQVNREAKGEPALEQLRESGNIEQDADVVIFMDRPTLRGVETDSETGQSWLQAGQFIVGKNRQGITGKAKFSHDKRYKRIFSYQDIHQQTYEEVLQKASKPWHNQESRDVPF